MHELAADVFWLPPVHSTDRPILGAVAGSRATLLIDAGNSPAHARRLLGDLAPRALPPIESVMLTHAHWDHVFGATVLPGTLIASAETADRLATMATYEWTDTALDERVEAGLEIPFCRDMMKAEMSGAERATFTVRIPDRTFEASMVVDLGDREVHLLHVGGDHAPDSSVAVVPGVAAFLGDCVYQHLHAEPNYLTRRHLVPLLDRLLDLDVAWFVLAHDDAPLSRAAFVELAAELRSAGDAAGATAPDHAAEDEERSDTVRAFRAGRVREVESLIDLDVEYARFNAIKTVQDARPSRFETCSVGPLLVTVDPARDDSYYHRVLGLEGDTLPWFDRALDHLRDAPEIRIDVASPTAERVTAALRQRGFAAEGRLLWLVRPTADARPDDRARLLGADERDRVRSLLELERPIEDSTWTSRRSHLCTDRCRVFGVEVDGDLVAMASTFVGAHGAILGNAFTIDDHRGRGFHRALLAARLADAAALGLSAVVVDVEPRTTSHRNCDRAGFTPVCTQTRWSRRAP